MFGRRITLFKLFGFEVRLDASWLIIALLITWSLAVGFFPSHYPNLPARDYWAMAIVAAFGLFGSIVVHEFSHSLVARRYGLPMKGITLFIFGGVAEMSDEPPNAKTEFLMAIAGPLASIAIGIVFYVVYLLERGLWSVPVVAILAYLSWINWILAAFNMIPAFPLDGGRVLRSALWYWKGNLPRATQIASRIGSGFGALLIAFAVLQLFYGNFIGAMWWFLIGMFLRGAAQSSYQQLMVRRGLEGEPIRRFMNTNPITVPLNISVEELVEDYIYKHHFKMFPVVTPSGELAGCVTTSQVKQVPRDSWRRWGVRDILQPCTTENTISPETTALAALSMMNRPGLSRLMVVDGDRLVAIVTLKDLLAFLAVKLDLEGHPGGLPSGPSPESSKREDSLTTRVP